MGKPGITRKQRRTISWAFFRGGWGGGAFSRSTLGSVIGILRCCQCDQIRYIFYQIRLDALRQHPLLYIIATFRTGGGSPTRSKQLW